MFFFFGVDKKSETSLQIWSSIYLQGLPSNILFISLLETMTGQSPALQLPLVIFPQVLHVSPVKGNLRELGIMSAEIVKSWSLTIRTWRS